MWNVHFRPKGLFIMLVINYVYVSWSFNSSHWMFSIQISKHAFKKAVFTCFGSVPGILESLEKGEKCSKWLKANWLRVLFLRFLNKFLLKPIEYSSFWENMSSDLIFHLYWKLDLHNWCFSHFGTLWKIRYATSSDCLLCCRSDMFLEVQQ